MTPDRSDARFRINEKFREDRHRAERTISNINKIKGLEKVLGHRDAEIKTLKATIESKDRKYQAMKSRANAFKRQLFSGQGQFFGQNPFIPQMMSFPSFGSSLPRSISDETIKSV